jgi:hypothetical protein
MKSGAGIQNSPNCHSSAGWNPGVGMWQEVDSGPRAELGLKPSPE